MKDIARRRQLIIDILASKNNFLTVKEISYILNASRRTIHSDLKFLETKYHFLKKRGVGVKLINNNPYKNNDIYSIYNRRIEIARKLFLASETITINALSKQYYVSQSSIVNDLNWIKENIINNLQILLQSDKSGTKVICTENERIRALVLLNINIFEEYKDINDNFDFINVFSKIYSLEICNVCWQVINLLRNEQFLPNAEYYLQNIYLFLIAIVYRMQKENHFQKENNNFLPTTQVMQLNNYLLANDIFNYLNSHLKHKIYPKEEDILYLSLILRANKIFFMKSSCEPDGYPKQFAEMLVQKMTEILHIDLVQNKQLIKMITAHCLSMFERLHNKVRLKNPMLYVIKQDYHAMFELIWLAIDAIDHTLSKNISEDEVGFLMLYFQNEMEKHKKSKKIIVVCPNGIVASNLISFKLKEILPTMDIIEVASINKILLSDISDYTFIISTVPIEQQVIPVIQVSMLLSCQDIKKIKKIYEDISKQESNQNDITEILANKYLDERLVFYNDVRQSKEAIIKKICTKLTEIGFVSNEYYDDVLNREKISATDIISGGAIPHASCKYVNNTCFALYVSKKPIEWGNYSVKVIVFFVLAKDDVKNAKKLLNQAFNFIKNKETVEILSSINSKEELWQMIQGKESNDC